MLAVGFYVLATKVVKKVEKTKKTTKELRNPLWFIYLFVPLQSVMNWKFYIAWAVKFALCMVVYSYAAKLTNSLWWAFLMALGILILIAILESYIMDWIEKWKEKHK